jgi:hypothetical protein
MCRSSIGWSDTHHPLISRNHMDSSNPTASTGVAQYQIETCKTLSVLATHRDSENDSIWDARRHAPSCMGATESQSNWPEMRKTRGKPLALQHGLQKANGEDRNRTFGCFLNVSREFERCLYDSFDLSIVGNRCKSSTAT